MSRRVLLITGAGGRLGRALCAQLRSEYAIAGVFHTRMPTVPTQRDLYIDPLRPGEPVAGNAERIFAITSDLLGEDASSRIVELALARFDRIDAVIHAAVRSRWGSLVQRGPALEEMQQQLMLNVSIPALLSAEIARSFWVGRERENRAENRCVINVSSIAGVNVYCGLGQGVYSASKAALNFLTMHMADEYAALGVRVNAIAPNSFPAIVSTARVVDGVLSLDRGTMTGRTLVIDRAESRLA